MCYRTLDTVSSQVQFGYRTLWTYMFEHANGGGVSEDAVEEFLALALSCGKFSYAEAPKRYPVILGVTGTLKQALESKTQGEILKKDYKFRNVT